jgi:mono/diheme cytochrome c family protein
VARLALVFTVLFIGAAIQVSLCADESFITQYEYGQMLYENPRGIGCNHCHGKAGEGANVATYMDDGKKVVLHGPDIRRVTIEELRKSLESRHRVMPTYFLTNNEIRAIYTYLHKERE